MRILQTLRGIAATQLTWAVVWVTLSALPFGVAKLVGTDIPLRVLGVTLLSQALTGAIGGGVFATVLLVAGRRKTFETLSLPWIAACGAVGGALFPFGVRAVLSATLDVPLSATALASTLVSNAILGAGCAALSLTIARRAPALRRVDASDVPALDVGSDLSAGQVAKPKDLATSR